MRGVVHVVLSKGLMCLTEMCIEVFCWFKAWTVCVFSPTHASRLLLYVCVLFVPRLVSMVTLGHRVAHPLGLCVWLFE